MVIRNFAQLTRARAAENPHRLAYSFLGLDGVEPLRMSYGALDRSARAVAAILRQRLGWRNGQPRVLLLCDTGPDYVIAFLGCLYAGALAVPTYPPPQSTSPARIARSLERIRAIANDAGAEAVLATSDIIASTDAFFQAAPQLASLEWIDPTGPGGPGGVDLAAADHWREDWVAELAFLQYTSGSTSTPKGVMVSHRTLLHTLADTGVGWHHEPDSTIVSWLPLFHDMGLIYGMLAPQFYGIPGVLMSPASFLKRPALWLEAITHFRGTHTAAPNFAFELCVNKVSPEERARLDLSCLRVALNAAETVRAETIERFNEAFARVGLDPGAIRPGYGLAECTLKATTVHVGDASKILDLDAAALERGIAMPVPGGRRRVVSCGRPALGTEVCIVEPDTRLRCPDGTVGEIWIRGPGVADGYWRNPEATEATFRAQLADSGEGPFLRTGDLGFILGDLFMTGRCKDLIIIDGRNHYPQDVERTIERCHESLRPGCGTAFAVEGDSGELGELVIAVQEIDPRAFGGDPSALDALCDRLAAAVLEGHDLSLSGIALVRPGTVPKTSSGKLQRRACRTAWLSGQLDLVHRWSRRRAHPTGLATSTRSDELVSVISTLLAEATGVSASDIDRSAAFASYGLTSRAAVVLAGDLSRHLGREVAPVVFWEHPSIERLAAHLAGPPNRPSEAIPVDSAPDRSVDPNVPIAIVGIGCRLPTAHGPAALWQLLCEGRDAIGHRSGRPGGYLDDVDAFDSEFFGVAPREAKLIDPQQRLALETAWEALEDAGIAPTSLAGAPVGVFVGVATSDYAQMMLSAGVRAAPVGTGTGLSVVAGRIAYQLDLQGPALVVDTACSSSLVAVQLACEALRAGQAHVVLAGGVNLVLSDDLTEVFTAAGMLAPDGRCKPFDASANGYVRSEGVGLVVMKRSNDAERDGDRIYALIRGGAVNQDGRTNGLSAPSRWAQEAVIRQACAQAGVPPGEIGYVEAHGTGTSLGDPIEALALGAVLAEGRGPDDRCAVGSLKSNVGHLEAAAGIAGLIKVALMLHHRALPPSLHFERPNPLIPFESLPLRVQTELAAWESAGRRRAGVSSFGFSGTNAHVVLEEAALVPPTADPGYPLLFLLSGHSAEALRVRAADLRDLLARQLDTSLVDVASTLARGRAHLTHRVAWVAADRDECLAALDAFLDGRSLAAAKRELGMDEAPGLLTEAAALFMNGGVVDTTVLGPRGRPVSLVAYPFARERHWFATASGHIGSRADGSLGAPRTSSAHPGTWYWDVAVPSLYVDHVVSGGPVFPAAASVELALAATRACPGSGAPCRIEGLTILRSLPLSPTPRVEVALVARPHGFDFKVSSWTGNGWDLHASARCVPATAGLAMDVMDLAVPRGERLTRDGLYEELRRRGVAMGARFQTLTEAWFANDEAIARITLPAGLDDERERAVLHALVLDAVLQAAAVAATRVLGTTAALLPSGIGSVEVLRPGAEVAWARVRPSGPLATGGQDAEMDATLFGPDGARVAEVHRASFRALTLVSDRVESRSLRDTVRQATQAERRRMIDGFLRERINVLLEVPVARIDMDRALLGLGLDSIAAVELIADVDAAFGVRLPATAMFDYPTFGALLDMLTRATGLDRAPNVEETQPRPPRRQQVGRVESLTESEAEAELLAMLANLERPS